MSAPKSCLLLLLITFLVIAFACAASESAKGNPALDKDDGSSTSVRVAGDGRVVRSKRYYGYGCYSCGGGYYYQPYWGWGGGYGYGYGNYGYGGWGWGR